VRRFDRAVASLNIEMPTAERIARMGRRARAGPCQGIGIATAKHGAIRPGRLQFWPRGALSLLKRADGFIPGGRCTHEYAFSRQGTICEAVAEES
jgi:hypothetical protein